MRFLPLCIVLLAVAGCSGPHSNQAQPTNDTATQQAPAGPRTGVDRSHKGEAAPAATFKDPDGGDISLADFKGTPVLVNLWASWCIPCRKELPSLDRLARAHDADGKLGVIAVSQDSGPQPSVVAFLDQLGITDLGAYHDPGSALSGALGPNTVLPTSILYGADGREVWRFVGDLDWSGPEAARLLAEAGAAPKG
jgi:thiol-disulfide isomerase/thioredoxin